MIEQEPRSYPQFGDSNVAYSSLEQDLESDMSEAQINETTLITNLESGGIRRLKLIQGKDRKFMIRAVFAWKGGEYTLVTQRKTPRIWASLDRLLKHIETKYHNVPVIELHLWKETHDHDDEKGGSS
ncbi:MAG: hypothetical protein BACC_04465 [Bacteroides sp.]